MPNKMMAPASTGPPPPATHDLLLLELERFPSHETCLKALDLGGQCQEHLQSQQTWKPSWWEEWQALINECRHSRACWEWLAQATDDSGSEAYRRLCLEELRRLLGEPAYWQGQMPLPVPESAWWE